MATFNGAEFKIFDCRLTGAQEAGMPGRILRIEDDGFDVRLNGGVLRVLRVQPKGGTKVGAGECRRWSGRGKWGWRLGRGWGRWLLLVDRTLGRD